MPRRADTLWLVALGVVLLIVALLGVSLGSVALPLGDVVDVLMSRLRVFDAGTALNETIVWDYRIPRVLAAALIGAGLTVAGITLQDLVRNLLADPYVIGVSFGAVLVMVLGSSAVFGLGVSSGAFAGAVVILITVFLFAQRRGAFSASRLVLAGVALGYLAAAGTSFVQLQADPGQISGILFWSLGSVAGARWESLLVPAVVIIACVLLLTRARSLNGPRT